MVYTDRSTIAQAARLTLKSKAEEQNVHNQTVKEPTSYGLPPVALEVMRDRILHSDLLTWIEPNTWTSAMWINYAGYSAEVRASNRRNQNSIIARRIDPDNHWFDVSTRVIKFQV